MTVRPSLTWVQVRDILRSTAVHIDAANTDATGIWRDVNGVASNQAGYLGPFYSRWYGSGRIDALAAVTGALTLGATADVVVRDNLGDSGIVPAVADFTHQANHGGIHFRWRRKCSWRNNEQLLYPRIKLGGCRQQAIFFCPRTRRQSVRHFLLHH